MCEFDYSKMEVSSEDESSESEELIWVHTANSDLQKELQIKHNINPVVKRVNKFDKMWQTHKKINLYHDKIRKHYFQIAADIDRCFDLIFNNTSVDSACKDVFELTESGKAICK